jgi:TPR repeat protein
MKKLLYTLLALLLLSQTGFSQNVTWGPWNPVSCWKGLHFHLSRGDYNASAQKYMWYCQFKNDYNQPVSFEFSILSPEEVSSYQAGTWSPNSLGRNGRMTLTASEDQSADPKDYFGVQPGTSALFTSGTKLFVAIKNVRFGNDDQSLPYATDECGRLSGKNDSAPVNDGGDAVGSTKKDADDLKSNDAKQQVDAVAPVQIATPLPVANAASSNANSQQTQADINNAQNPNNDAIQNALALSQAKINAMKPGGATPAQQHEIQQAQQQQTDANNAAVETSLNNLASAFVNVFKKPENQPAPSQPTEEKKEDVPVDQTVPDYADPNSSSYDEVKAFFTIHTAINTSEVPTYAEENASQGKFKVAYRLYYSMIQYPGDYSQQQMQSADRAVASYYQKGTGVEANADSARKYYLAAGDNDAANNVSNYTVPETPKTEEDADAGMSAEDKYQKGYNYRYHDKDYALAELWYKKAAEEGFVSAMSELSALYTIQNNYPEAFIWVKKAAEAGNSGCMYISGWDYQFGVGIQQDMAQAKYWYIKAGDAGDYDAYYTLGTSYYTGNGVNTDYAQAAKWLTIYVQLKKEPGVDAYNYLGNIYETGGGDASKSDLVKAKEYYLNTAQQGNIFGMNGLGRCYADEKNKAEALKWFTMSLNAGDKSAVYAIKMLNDPPENKVVHKRKKK